ncbi:hypothetical protein F8O01_08145 [Pseudoclavibacter chungangensis]|uniref:Uncharacterized protein n=1 Tax=Pseudoclavibacter chungangensis TaxID=587635 RepID=A0A7J5BN61_9MICO|nr:hypothetical protein [Pseudoclavibacter chungangensis]KAB1653419.1 hypothetical protein F8O01_15200 [Pseudoclavibacter chungangensis]KAB1657217.1 hypothetical protein F8O01_08145 [Pseudoclavibacter chungangensis]NYJ66352.1 hypothetical protein [Pseudoclavibacter chungangensis]
MSVPGTYPVARPASGTVPGAARASRVLGFVVGSLGVVIAAVITLSELVVAEVGSDRLLGTGFLLAILGLVPLVLAIVLGHIGLSRSRALGASTAAARTGLLLGYLSLIALPAGSIGAAFVCIAVTSTN